MVRRNKQIHSEILLALSQLTKQVENKSVGYKRYNSLKNTINQMEVININKALHLTISEDLFFSNANETFSKIKNFFAQSKLP